MDHKQLDKIVKETLKIIEQGKKQIYEIAEHAKQEYYRIQAEVEDLKKESHKIIKEVDTFQIKEKLARLKLAEVSKNFSTYSENDIKTAYQNAQEMQIKLVLLMEQEKQTRLRRDHLEISLKRLEVTAKKAENLITHVGVAFQYLQESINGITPKIEELQNQQNIGIKVIKAQEKERRRVAREIHDGPAQLLTNIVLRIEICQKLIELEEMEKVRQELNGIKETVKNSLQDVRKIIFDLRPMTLDDLGLVPAIKRHIENCESSFYGTIFFNYLGQESRYDSTIELSVFRIFQEALNNAIKYADAKEINVKLEMREDKVILVVRDNGKGFDIEQAIHNKERESLGLISMRERTEILKGEIKVASVINRGTEITVRFPIKGRDA